MGFDLAVYYRTIKINSQCLAIIFALLSLPSRGEATTVVIIRTDTSIVIASDSLSSRITKQRASGSTVCKIFRSSGVVSASAGIAEDPKFSADKIAAAVGAQQGSVAYKVDLLAKDIRKPFLDATQRLHRALPNTYIRFSSDPGKDLIVALVGMESGVPTVGLVELKAINNSAGSPIDVSVLARICPGTLCDTPNKEHFWVLGQSTAALNVVNSSFLFWTGDNATDARRMVQVEIDDVPLNVGPPIDVMVIDKAGQHWIDPTGSCGAKKRRSDKDSKGKSQHKF